MERKIKLWLLFITIVSTLASYVHSGMPKICKRVRVETIRSCDILGFCVITSKQGSFEAFEPKVDEVSEVDCRIDIELITETLSTLLE